MIKNRENTGVLSSFWLKIIALLTMTIDHIAIFLADYGVIRYSDMSYTLLRAIGRISLPLFIFMIIEGIFHTKNYWKYIIRLSIGLLVVGIPYGILFSQGFSIQGQNPFFDLLIVALFYGLLNQKGWLKSLIVIPLAYATLSTAVDFYSFAEGVTVNWFPMFLRCGYGLYALLIGGAFYVSRLIADRSMKKLIVAYDCSIDELRETSYYRYIINGFSAGLFVIVNVLLWAIFGYGLTRFDYIDIKLQMWTILAFIPLILYNGKLGYHKRWFQYGTYLYFDLHLAILYVIFQLVFVGSLF